jgi:hypothetical protein
VFDRYDPGTAPNSSVGRWRPAHELTFVGMSLTSSAR